MADGTATPGFEADIKPLFRDRDRAAMRFAFDLWSYDEVSLNAEGILTRLRDGDMPCDERWPAQKIDLVERWIAGGKPA
jgi:hypothetical protein